MTERVPSPGLLYPAKDEGEVYIKSRLDDYCDVWRVVFGGYHYRIGIRTVAQFWQLVK